MFLYFVSMWGEPSSDLVPDPELRGERRGLRTLVESVVEAHAPSQAHASAPTTQTPNNLASLVAWSESSDSSNWL